MSYSYFLITTADVIVTILKCIYLWYFICNHYFVQTYKRMC